MPKVTVHVTQEDIDNGVQFDCSRCPVALSLNRLVNTNEAVYNVTDFVILFYLFGIGNVFDDPDFRVFLPQEVTKWVQAYDLGAGILKPFDFSINIAAKFLRPEAIPTEVQ